MQDRFSEFQSLFIKNDVKILNEYLNNILYKFQFFYRDIINEQNDEILQLPNESKIIIIDECQEKETKYDIICFNYNLIFMKFNFETLFFISYFFHSNAGLFLESE